MNFRGLLCAVFFLQPWVTACGHAPKAAANASLQQGKTSPRHGMPMPWDFLGSHMLERVSMRQTRFEEALGFFMRRANVSFYGAELGPGHWEMTLKPTKASRDVIIDYETKNRSVRDCLADLAAFGEFSIYFDFKFF